MTAAYNHINPPDRSALAKIIDRIDEVTGQAPELPVEQLHIAPPSFGAAHRQGISAMVDGVASEIAEKCKRLRGRIDELEQQVMRGSGGAKHTLLCQVELCQRVDAELARIGETIEDIARTVEPLKNV